MIAHIIIKLLKIIILFLFGLSISHAQIINGNFESFNTDGKPQGWYLNNQDTLNNILRITTSDKHQGKHSLQFNKKEVKAMLMASNIFSIEISKLTKLQVSSKIKTDSKQLVANFFIQFFDENKKRIGGEGSQMVIDPSKSGEWQDVNFSILVQPEVKSMVLFVNMGGLGNLFIDEVKTDWINTPPAKEIIEFSEEIKSKIQQMSIVNDSLIWKDIIAQTPAALAGLTIENGAQQVANFYLSHLRKAKDFHSQYYSPEKYRAYTSKPIEENKTSSPLELPSGKMLDERIAYVNVPRFGSTFPESQQAFADHLNDLVLSLQQQNPKGWVIDLRTNSGGNMHPMIAGLNALIADGNIITFKTNQGEQPLYSSAGKFGRITLKITPKRFKVNKIAVLTSIKTASSGEMTAISFIGMPNVKLIGENTAGLTTANQFFPLSNGGALNLANAVVKDRLGKIYKGQINPDILTKSQDPQENLNQAIKWILE